MYALIKFYDNVYYVGRSRDIINTKNVIKCKYSDGRTYPANIIAKNSKLKLSHIRLFLIILLKCTHYLLVS